MNAITTQEFNTLVTAGKTASMHAAQNVFADYTSRKAANTVTAQYGDLKRFSEFLTCANVAGAATAKQLQTDPEVWRGITWGLVAAFVKWQLGQGFAITTINRSLSVLKVYAKLCVQAGTIPVQEYAMIRTVMGYGRTEAKRVNTNRTKTRVGNKKSTPVRITDAQAKQLKRYPNNPQGRRDALLMCLLLDHGLRVGEVAILQVENFDLKAGSLRFERPKVDGLQTHKLTADTLKALCVWVQSGDCLTTGPLLRGSLKSRQLTDEGMSERAIQFRVKLLGEQLGITGLSPHDCRHYWTTYWSSRVDLFRLQEAGGWASLEMPRRYTERAAVANHGMT